MRRRKIPAARRIVTPSQLGGERMAAIQAVCDFSLDNPALDWAMWTVLKHDTHLRAWRLDGRQADLGIVYSVEEDGPIGGFRLVCNAHGHDANPLATHCVYRRRPNQDIAEFERDEREWLERVADWHHQTQSVVDAGGDPRRPGAGHVVADPCLARLSLHHGVPLDTLLAAIPRHGRFLIGRNWYRPTPMPRVLEIGDVQAHLIRTAARIRTQRIGFGRGVSYSPPEPERARRVGILYAPRTALSETLHDALIGEPLSRIVEHPALDVGLRIRAVSKSGTGIAVRVTGCDHVRPMSEVEPHPNS